MLRRLAAIVALCLLSLPAARAGEEPILFGGLQGHVYEFGGGVPGMQFEVPAAGTLVYLERLGAPPGQEQIEATITDGLGFYAFLNLIVGATYRVTAPVLAKPGTCEWDMYLVQPDGSRIRAPGAVAIPPGPPTGVDLAAPEGCGAAAPCGTASIARDVVAVGLVRLEDQAAPIALKSNFQRNDVEDDTGPVSVIGACITAPWFSVGRPVVVRLQRPDAVPEVPAVEVTLPTTGSFLEVALALFTASPLEDGESVRVEIDLAQPALAGLRLLPGGPATFVREGDVIRWDVTYTAGTPLPMLQAGFYPEYDLDVRAFVEGGTPDGVYGPGDDPLCDLPIRVQDLKRGTIVEDRTGHDGHLAFALPQGVYEVRVTTTYPAPGPWTARVIEADGTDPVDFAFAPGARPEIPSTEGPVHEVSVETEVYVGSSTTVPVDVRLLAPSAWGDVEIDRVTATAFGGITKPVASFRAKVLTLESVTIEDGWARARVRLTAGGTKFPTEAFGDKPLRLSVALNRVLRTGLLTWRCENLQPGGTAEGDFTKDTYWRIQPGVAVFDVVHLVGFDSWLRCKPQ